MTANLGVMGLTFRRCLPCSDKEQAEATAKRIEKEAEAAEFMRRRREHNRMAECGIGPRFSGVTFADYAPTCNEAVKVLAQCQSYVDNFGSGKGESLLMLGSPGTGKNMLAAAICLALIKKDFGCISTTAIKLVRKIKASWADKTINEQTIIDSMVAPHLLVIDEIGVQFGSATEQLYLTEIINERYEKRRPTILISNLKLSELTAVMGERVIDRFYDDGSKLMVFSWGSYRRIAANG